MNANNQVSTTGFTFDGVGNETHDATFAYVWNAESEIKTGGGVNYTYDGDGDRVEKSNGKIYWYGAGSEILDESDASGNFTDEYVYFGGQRIAHRVVSGNSIYYYAEDMLGSSRSLVLAGQTSPCYDADFYPFGGEHDYTNTCPQNYKFTGKERDPETDNDDFDARYYSSTYGRFLSADWSAVPAPVPYANLTNPQTLNLYAMVGDNPESFADLDGHCDDRSSSLCDQPAPVPPPQTQQNTVTVEEVKGQGANGGPLGFDHAAVSVNGQQAVGLEQQKDSGTAAVEDKTTPGAVKPIDPNREVKDKATIQVTPEQAAKIQTFLDNAAKNPPNYNLYHSNCAQFCESALQAGGVKNVPNDITPHGLVEDLKSTPHWTDYFRLVPLPVF